MVTMDTMARGLLRPSLDMVIMVMDMVLDMVMDMAMGILGMDMVVMDTMDIMARGLLMLSQDMDIMAMDMDTDMVMVMAMVMDTMAKHICCSFSEFSTNEVGPCGSSQKHTIFISKKINIEKRKK